MTDPEKIVNAARLAGLGKPHRFLEVGFRAFRHTATEAFVTLKYPRNQGLNRIGRFGLLEQLVQVTVNFLLQLVF